MIREVSKRHRVQPITHSSTAEYLRLWRYCNTPRWGGTRPSIEPSHAGFYCDDRLKRAACGVTSATGRGGPGVSLGGDLGGLGAGYGIWSAKARVPRMQPSFPAQVKNADREPARGCEWTGRLMPRSRQGAWRSCAGRRLDGMHVQGLWRASTGALVIEEPLVR